MEPGQKEKREQKAREGEVKGDKSLSEEGQDIMKEVCFPAFPILRTKSV